MRLHHGKALLGSRRVLATEVSKPAVAAAGENLAANGVGNVTIARLTAEELGMAWRGERTFERLRLAGVDLAAMNFTTILVSPGGPPSAVLFHLLAGRCLPWREQCGHSSTVYM